MADLFQKGLGVLLKKQTNIISAAYMLMATVFISQILGLIRERLLVAIFGASNQVGIYLAATKLPETLFNLIIAGALSSAFIPVFSEFLSKDQKEEADKMASTLLLYGSVIFSIVSLVLFIFANYFVQLLNLGAGFTPDQVMLMANLMRIIIVGQLFFIMGSFFAAILQSYNHFFLPGIAAALYNFGIIVGLIVLSPIVGIYSAAWGIVLGAFLFVAAQIPLTTQVGFSFRFTRSLKTAGVMEVIKLMWPRTLSLGIFQIGSILILDLVSFLANPGRNYLIFTYAMTLMLAPIGLFGQTIAQAAFPVLSREKNNLSNFKTTFITSFNQMFYLVLPISAFFIILRIPIVRLAFGASKFDWDATVLTGTTLAYFSVSIFAQALLYLVSRGFYALHDTKTPLVVGAITTAVTIFIGGFFVVVLHQGVESIAVAYSIGQIINIFVLMVLLDKKVGSFDKKTLGITMGKIFMATLFTGFALYIPIKLLDRLVFDTTYTMNLILLTGISTAAGLTLYIFLTWLFNVKEATTFLLLFKKLGNWREILGKSQEAIGARPQNP